MQTRNQTTGEFGEDHVARECGCPRCKKSRTLRRLPANFPCADLICSFCGWTAQVKTTKVTDLTRIPDKRLLGGAWAPHAGRLQAKIFTPLFLVLRDRGERAIYYLAADHQSEAMFEPRSALSQGARRAGWQGYRIDLSTVRHLFVRLH